MGCSGDDTQHQLAFGNDRIGHRRAENAMILTQIYYQIDGFGYAYLQENRCYRTIGLANVESSLTET